MIMVNNDWIICTKHNFWIFFFNEKKKKKKIRRGPHARWRRDARDDQPCRDDGQQRREHPADVLCSLERRTQRADHQLEQVRRWSTGQRPTERRNSGDPQRLTGRFGHLRLHCHHQLRNYRDVTGPRQCPRLPV